MRKILPILLALAMVLTLLPVSTFAVGTDRTEDLAALEEQMRQELFSADDRIYAEDYEAPEAPDPDEIIRVLVETRSAPALEIASTQGTANMQAAEVTALKGQESTIQAAKRQLGLEPVHRTGYLVNMVSYDIRRGDLETLEKLPGVLSVTEATQYQVDLFSAKEMSQVYEAWQMGDTGYTGKETVISIIDTGVNYLHHDMYQNPDTLKYTQSEMEEKIQDLGHGQWFSDKVPFGYSYVSERNEILNSANIHGYHVAGIAAANGSEEERYISGVAPDAQVLAMQVYDAETGNGGFSDDIICAIEDSVKLGADIINMSLGQDCGFYEDDRYINRAVNRANEQGVFVAISAGNAGMSTDIYEDDGVSRNDWGLIDTATVSDPSTARGGVSIASVEGNGNLAYSFDTVVEDTSRTFACMMLTYEDLDITDAEFFDAGNGDYTIFGEYVVDDNWNYTYVPNPDVVGKVVLVSYSDGDYAPFNPIYYGELSGCAAVIVYYTGSDDLPLELRYQTSDSYHIPSAIVGRSDGEYLLSLASSGTVAQRVTGFDGFFFRSADADVTASAFSAWGPTPSLEIKPEIAGPGGMIFSLAAGEKVYTVMSGTSMSSPFVAGVAALVKQRIHESRFQVENEAEWIRHILMNTANPVVDELHDSLYSVRQQGAGLVNAPAALENTVTVTYNGKAAIELQDELNKTTTGTLHLTNYGTKSVTYSLSATDVYTDYTDPVSKDYYDVPLDGAKVTFDPATVVVPAGGTAEVTFTLIIPESKEGHFVEGYVLLQSTKAPQLSVPFLGFMGDWDAEPIVDLPEWDENKVIESYEWYAGYSAYGTGLVSIHNAEAAMLGEEYTETPNSRGYIQYENIAISPNGDGHYDVAIPWLGMLRNAHDVRFQVTDSDGAVLFESGTVSMMRKLLAPDLYTHGVALTANGEPVGWDGTTYDQTTGESVPMPEGEYVVRVQSRVRENGDWQSIELPLAIDLTGPKFESMNAQRNDDGTLTVSFCAKDLHGLHNVVAVNVNGYDNVWTRTRTRWEYDVQTDTYTLTFNPADSMRDWNVDLRDELCVYIMVSDKAGNTTMNSVTIPAQNEDDAVCGLYNMSLEQPTYIKMDRNSVFYFYGYAPEGSTATFNGKEATFYGRSFSVQLQLTEDVTPVEVLIQDASGDTLLSGTAQLVLDRDDPFHGAFQVEGGCSATAIGSGWALMLHEDYPVGTKISVRTKMSDTSELYVRFHNYGTGESSIMYPDEDGYLHFEVELAELPELGEGLVGAQCSLGLRDAVGYYRDTNLYLYTKSTAQYGASVGGLDLTENLTPMIQNVSSLTQVTQDMLQPDGTFRVEGYLFNQVDKLLINGVEAVVDPDSLLWYCDIQLEPGVNIVNAYAYKGDAQGKSYLAQIYYTGEGPGLTLHVHPDANGVYRVYEDRFLLSGSVTTLLDDAQIYINGRLVEGAYDFGNASGADTVSQSFSHEIPLHEGHNYVTVLAADYSGAATSVTVDLYYMDFPFEDVAQDAWYRDSVEFAHACGWIRGITDTTFAPNRELTRAQLVTILYRMAGEPEVTAASPFTDVAASAWYGDAVTWAAENGIAEGMSATAFAPNQTATREQMVTFLARFAEFSGVDTTATGDLGDFTDASKVSAYAEDAMTWAVHTGIIHGMGNGKLDPKGTATRAQFATTALRLYDLLQA